MGDPFGHLALGQNYIEYDTFWEEKWDTTVNLFQPRYIYNLYVQCSLKMYNPHWCITPHMSDL